MLLDAFIGNVISKFRNIKNKPGYEHPGFIIMVSRKTEP